MLAGHLSGFAGTTNQLRKVRLSGESDRNGSYETDAFGNLFDVMKRNAP